VLKETAPPATMGSRLFWAMPRALRPRSIARKRSRRAEAAKCGESLRRGVLELPTPMLSFMPPVAPPLVAEDAEGTGDDWRMRAPGEHTTEA
jgi:hypothetical protein